MEEQCVQCPQCSSNNISVRFVDETLSYSCNECEWYFEPPNPFFFEGWYVELKQALAPVDILYSLFSNEETSHYLMPRLQGVSFLSDWAKESRIRPDSPGSLSFKFLQGEISSARDIYLAQQIVIVCVYAETILDDFLNKAVCVNKPMANAARKALKNNGLEVIIETWAQQYKIPLKRPLINDWKEIRRKRNLIAHEAKSIHISVETVYEAYGALIYLLGILGEIAIRAGVPFVDNFGILLDIRKQADGKEE